MEIYFHDPDDIPVPRSDVRIRLLNAIPYPDGQRIKVTLELTPFQERPDAELVILDSEGIEVASASIIETIDPKMEMTLHLLGTPNPGKYILKADVHYRMPTRQDEESQEEPENYEIQVVDRAQVEFNIP